MKDHIIYFGKMCIGKSTYLNKLKSGYVDFDKFIWTQLSNKTIVHFKKQFSDAIERGCGSIYTFYGCVKF
jgi:hypothetical protein